MTLVEESDQLNLTQSASTTNTDGEVIDASEKPWIVTGWTKDDDSHTALIHLSDDGSVADQLETVEFLNEWTQEFIENRAQSNS